MGGRELLDADQDGLLNACAKEGRDCWTTAAWFAAMVGGGGGGQCRTLFDQNFKFKLVPIELSFGT